MAIDWLVRWPKEEPTDKASQAFLRPPTSKVIGEVMEDYFSGLYMDLTEDQPGHWLIQLKGTHSAMFKRHGGRSREYLKGDGRYIEVWVWDYGIDVTVRMCDDVTLGLAKDFAYRCAQRWDGTVDDPG